MKHLEESHKQVSFFLFFYFSLSLLIINDVLVIYLVLSRWSLKICSLFNVLSFVTWKLKREFSNYLEEVWRGKKGGIKQISHTKLRLILIRYQFCYQVWKLFLGVKSKSNLFFAFLEWRRSELETRFKQDSYHAWFISFYQYTNKHVWQGKRIISLEIIDCV